MKQVPTLNWIGKDKVVNHANDVSFHVLERKYSFDAQGNHEKDNGSQNKIIHGDNLLVLKSLLPEYEGRIKCIYIDPPYNTGNENWIYNDNVNDPKIKKWLGEVVGKEGEDLSRHDKWLCMMYPRLKLLSRLLSDEGVIFISIDANELYNLKLICDEIFGSNNFLAMLTRRCMHTVRNSSKDFNKNADYILTYAKNKEKITSDKNNRIREQVDKSENYRLNDNDGRGFYKFDPIYARNYAQPYTFKFKNGVVWSAPEGSYPRYSVETLTTMEENDQINFDGSQPRAKRYLNEVQQGQPPDTFMKSEIVKFNSDGTRLLAEILGIDKAFSQPKPIQLIEYLISILPKNKNAIILDSFAGSGTTAHAVLKLNKEDGGNRKFILVEMEDYAERITAERVKRVIQGYGDIEGVGGDFNFYEIGEPLLIDDDLNESVPLERIRVYIWYTETKTPYIEPPGASTAFLGTYNDTAYYFHYEKSTRTILDFQFLQSISEKATNYVIYADECALDDDFLTSHGITFKKIPRDISKL